MIETTEGIVLHSLRYSDSTRIVKIFTRSAGLLAFLVSTGSGSKGDKGICSVFNLLEVSFVVRERAGLIRPMGLRRSIPLAHILSDPLRASVALFLAEVLHKTLEEDYSNAQLFDFLKESIVLLDTARNPVNLHLGVLAKIISFYGFAPGLPTDDRPVFDLVSGSFLGQRPGHPHFLEGDLGQRFVALFYSDADEIHEFPLNNQERVVLLTKLVDYLRIHVEHMKEIRSLQVLQEVFGNP